MYEKAQAEQAAASENGGPSADGGAEEEVVDAEVVDEAK